MGSSDEEEDDEDDTTLHGGGGARRASMTDEWKASQVRRVHYLHPVCSLRVGSIAHVVSAAFCLLLAKLIMEGHLSGDGKLPPGDTPLTNVTAALGFSAPLSSAGNVAEEETAGNGASAAPVLSASPADVSSPAPAARPVAPAPATPGADASAAGMRYVWCTLVFHFVRILLTT